jgi:anaphase-promoting complex subunit 4
LNLSSEKPVLKFAFKSNLCRYNAALLNRVAPAAEAAVLRLSELQALARWKERVGPVGLSEPAADAALAAAERACLAVGVAIRAATASATRLRAFFVLLLRTQRVLAGENPDGGGAAGDEQNLLPAANPSLVREFLEDGIRVDRLGEQLSAGAGDGAGVGGWAKAGFAAEVGAVQVEST